MMTETDERAQPGRLRIRPELESARITISLPKALVDELNDLARKHGTARSRILTMMIARYVRDLDEVLSELSRPIVTVDDRKEAGRD